MCGPRGGLNENRVRLAPCFGTLPGSSLNPGGSVNAHCVQASVSQRLASGARPRRRFVPPSPSVSVSQSVNQRWRERPRCPALRVTPGRRDGVVHAIVGRVACRCPCAHVVQEERAAREHTVASRFAGRMRPTNRTEIGSCGSHVFPPEMSRLPIQIQASHHRAFHDGAVVNALRCASTRPTAGPSGIDEASARHVFGHYAMVGDLSITRRGLTREWRRRMLTSSRQCRTALPLFAATANGARIRPAPTGHGIERTPKHRRLMHADRELVRRRVY
jgi:hypothetical protein